MKKSFLLLFSLLLSPQVMAEQAKNKPVLDKQKFSIGAGVSNNSVGRLDDTGIQVFIAYDLNKVNLVQGVKTRIELGYIDYGFSSVNDNGIWANAVIDGAISGKFGWLARAGFDFGDDSGLMLGAGLSLDFNEKTELNLEYVIRDEVDSLQLNLRYHM